LVLLLVFVFLMSFVGRLTLSLSKLFMRRQGLRIRKWYLTIIRMAIGGKIAKRLMRFLWSFTTRAGFISLGLLMKICSRFRRLYGMITLTSLWLGKRNWGIRSLLSILKASANNTVCRTWRTYIPPVR